jgi:hypothetical protein
MKMTNADTQEFQINELFLVNLSRALYLFLIKLQAKIPKILRG